MQFEKDRMYHIFNQGNNRRKIFFTRENYLFFLKKIKTHILLHADVLAWCLADNYREPNHFHLMVRVKDVFVPLESQGFTSSETLTKTKTRSLNDSIGIMLRSYTRAINKQEEQSGSLFRKETKAQYLDCLKGISPSFFQTASGTQLVTSCPEKDYPRVCFNYIHQNPVKAGLAKKSVDWEFSSAKDISGKRNGSLINLKLINELELIF